MLKAMGMIMVFMSCILFSVLKTDELKQKYENLKEIKKALFLLKNDISFSSKDLPLAIEEISHALSGGMRDFFSVLSDKLKGDEKITFEKAWEMSFKEYKKPFLPKDAEKIVASFSGAIGKLSKNAEIENIDKMINELEAELIKESENYKKNRQLILTLGIGASVTTLILFM